MAGRVRGQPRDRAGLEVVISGGIRRNSPRGLAVPAGRPLRRRVRPNSISRPPDRPIRRRPGPIGVGWGSGDGEGPAQDEPNGTLSRWEFRGCGDLRPLGRLGLGRLELLERLVEAATRLRLVPAGQGRVARGVEQRPIRGPGAVPLDRPEVERLVMRLQVGDLGVDPLDQPGPRRGRAAVVDRPGPLLVIIQGLDPLGLGRDLPGPRSRPRWPSTSRRAPRPRGRRSGSR